MRGLLVVMVVVGAVGLAAAEPKLAPAKAHRAWPRPVVTLASYKQQPAANAPSSTTARTLQAQGMSAYKAGNYNFAVRKFAAAMDLASSPELLYHAAQAYRLKGERAKALDLYEQYLEVAPEGAAAPICRIQVERLRDSLP